MSAKHRRVSGADMIAEQMVHAALQSEAIPAELNLNKSWKHIDVHEHQYEDDDSRMYIFEIFIPAAPSVVRAECTLTRWYDDNNYRTWGWLAGLCNIRLTNNDQLAWVFGCNIVDNEVIATALAA